MPVKLVGLVVAALSAAARGAEADMRLFAGAAGCDADDSGCSRDSPEAEKLMWVYHMSQDGQVKSSMTVTVGLTAAPAWLTVAPQRPNCLFAVLAPSSEITAFELLDGGIEPRGTVPSGGVNPVYSSVTADGRLLLVANYHGPDGVNVSTGASVASFSIAHDCTLRSAFMVPHSGSSRVHGRQDSAHPHSFVAAREDSKIAYACDLGQDLVVTYGVAPDGSLSELHRVRVPPGEGPRHLVQHPTEPYAYVVNELASSVRVFHVKGPSGELEALDSFRTLPSDVPSAGSKAAELAISTDGKTLYVTNRGRYNSVGVFDIVKGGSALRQRQQVPVSPFPRGMTLAPGGRVLVVAGQHNGTVQTFLTGAGGYLSWTGTNVTGPPTAAALAVAAPPKSPSDSVIL